MAVNQVAATLCCVGSFTRIEETWLLLPIYEDNETYETEDKDKINKEKIKKQADRTKEWCW